jgi:TonB family protein
MKKIITKLLFLVLLMSVRSQAQDVDSDNMADNEMGKVGLKVESNHSLNFPEIYEINIANFTKAKILCDAIARVAPSINAEKMEFTIPQGSIVETYKYFPKDASWAVKYNDKWCFVSATSIITVQEKIQESAEPLYDEPPKMLSEIQFIYPPDARKKGISGTVIVKILVSKTGSVSEAEIINSIPGLNEAAIKAITKLKFKPAKFKGKLVDAWIRIPINFEYDKF